MTDSSGHGVVYDIRLLHRVPDSVRTEFPEMQVRTAGTRTVLRFRADDPAQLSVLLNKVSSVGGAVTGLRRWPRRTARASESDHPVWAYEVWVRDELGSSLLWYLRCAHHVVPELTQVRVTLAEGMLQRFVRACADAGATIERVRRVGPAAGEGP